jgi:hypothetical protein
MRIVIASPPKTGNVWVKTLLSKIYGLKVLEDEPRGTPEAFLKKVERGWFEQNSIFHQHFRPTEDFVDLAKELNCILITTLRNPYDAFVSFYFHIQNNSRQFAEPHPNAKILGKPIDHPDVIRFAGTRKGGFGAQLVWARRWVACECSHIIRYEDLHSDPLAALRKVTDAIQPMTDAEIQHAIDESSAEKMRGLSRSLRRHVRKATVGDWRNHLNNDHLTAFRENYPGIIRKLGYTLEPPI